MTNNAPIQERRSCLEKIVVPLLPSQNSSYLIRDQKGLGQQAESFLIFTSVKTLVCIDVF